MEFALVLGFSSLWIMQVFDENLNVNVFRYLLSFFQR